MIRWFICIVRQLRIKQNRFCLKLMFQWPTKVFASHLRTFSHKKTLFKFKISNFIQSPKQKMCENENKHLFKYKFGLLTQAHNINMLFIHILLRFQNLQTPQFN